MLVYPAKRACWMLKRQASASATSRPWNPLSCFEPAITTSPTESLITKPRPLPQSPSLPTSKFNFQQPASCGFHVVCCAWVDVLGCSLVSRKLWMNAMALLASLSGERSGEPKTNLFLEFQTSQSTPKKFPKAAWSRDNDAPRKQSRAEGNLLPQRSEWKGPGIQISSKGTLEECVSIWIFKGTADLTSHVEVL